MAKGKTTGAQGALSRPRSVQLAEAGIETGEDFSNLMLALLSDVLTGKVAPTVANAACRAGVNVLKTVELTYRLGVAGSGGKRVMKLPSNK